jgi:hypothetical protein
MFSLHPYSRCYPLPSATKDVVLRQKCIVAKSRGVKTGWSKETNLPESSKEVYGSKGAAFPMMVTTGALSCSFKAIRCFLFTEYRPS